MTVSPVVIVLTTWPAGRDPGPIARTLVEERLAACVSVSGEMRSIYRWKDGIETEVERQLVIKTVAAAVEPLKARLAGLHPYEVPEFLVIDAADGSEAYLAWVQQSISS